VHGAAGQDESDDARAELRQAQRHLKWLLIEHEHNLEALQRVRRQRAKLREQAESLAAALAESRSAAYWAKQSAGDRPALRFGRGRAADPEADLVREVEAAEEFDGGWYLQQNPRAVRSGLSPALHYVRQGNAKKLDPGPRFSTAGYLRRHPEAADSGLPALLHALRTGNVGETTTGESDSSPAGDVHL
jgi:hypothetical protein